MYYKIGKIEELEQALAIIVAGDRLMMPKHIYPIVKHSVRAKALNLKCIENYCETPNNYPPPNSYGVEILFVYTPPKLKEVTSLDFVGTWKRLDNNAVYQFNRATGLAKMYNHSKPFDWKVVHQTEHSYMQFNQLRFSLLSFSPEKFSLKVNDKIVVFVFQNN